MTDDQVRALTALTGQLMSVGVSVEAMDNSTVSVKAVFSNKGLTNDLTFSSVGWFAKAGSGTETLIAVTPIEGTKLLGAGLPNSSTDAINIAMNMAIGDSTTVNVVIDPAGTVSPVDLDSAISKIQTDVDNKATKADVDKEITTLTADKANSTDITNLQNQIQAQQTKLTDDVYTKAEVDSKVSALNQTLTPVYVNSRDDVAAQDAYIVIVDDDN